MRITLSGTAGQGKTTLLEAFVNKWDMYETPEVTYRSLIKPGKHSKSTNKETQWAILNQMIDQIEKYSAEDNVIFDRGPIDNLIYSMWSYHKGESDIDELFVEKCIPVVRESMKLLDIIFYIPLTNASESTIDDDGTREIDIEYVREIDNFFKAIHKNWMNGDERFFPKEDRAAMIEIFGTTEERLTMLGMYLDADGEEYGEEDTLVDSNELYDQFGFKLGATEAKKYE